MLGADDVFRVGCAAFAFAFGMAAGSFAYVLALRLPAGVSIVRPRSSCSSCGAVLSARSLIPVLSFLAQRGRCLHCGERISWRYPASELACGGVFAALLFRYGPTWQFALLSVFFALLLAIFFVDLEHMIIPNALTLAAAVPASAQFLGHALSPVASYGDDRALAPLLGLVPGVGFFAVVYIAARLATGSDRSLGMGDIKLMFPVGLLLGFERCLWAVAVAVIAGGASACVLLAFKRKSRKDSIPFGPFIVIGAFVAALLP